MSNLLLLRRRGMMAAAKQVITLYKSDFSYGRGADYNYPYNSNYPQRISYIPFDIRIDNVGAWHFELDTNYSTAQIALHFFTQNVLSLVAAHSSIQGKYLDTGWKATSFNYNVPATYQSSPIVGFRITIRQSTSNPVISSNFTINSFIARKL